MHFRAKIIFFRWKELSLFWIVYISKKTKKLLCHEKIIIYYCLSLHLRKHRIVYTNTRKTQRIHFDSRLLDGIFRQNVSTKHRNTRALSAIHRLQPRFADRIHTRIRLLLYEQILCLDRKLCLFGSCGRNSRQSILRTAKLWQQTENRICFLET